MTCMEAQQMITLFINDTITLEQAEAFIDHVNHCASCREDLEVYYALLTAMKQLDEDKELSDNYAQDLKYKIQRIEEKIHHVKTLKIKRRFLLFFVIATFALFSSVQIGEQLAQETPPVYVPSEHNFILGYSGLPDVKNETRDFIDKYDIKAREYIDNLREGRIKLRRHIIKIWNQNRFPKLY